MIKFFVVCFTSLSLVFLPIYEAQALIPYASIPTYSGVAIGGGSGAEGTIATLAASGGSSANPIGIGALSLAVGAAAGYLGVQYVCDSITACADAVAPIVRIPLSNNPANAIPAPTGGLLTVLPTNTPTCWINGAGVCSSSLAAACSDTAAMYAAAYGASSTGTVSGTSCVFTLGGAPFPAGNFTPASGGSSPTCPSGYTLNGSVCNLTNPYASPDKKIDFALSPTTGFAPVAGEADPLPSVAPTVYGSNNQNIKLHGYIIGADGKKNEIWVDEQKAALDQANSDAYNLNVSYIEHNMGQCANNSNCSALGATASDVSEATKYVATLTATIQNGVVTSVSQKHSVGEIAPLGSSYQVFGGSTYTVGANDLVVVTPNAVGVTTPPVQVQTSTIPPSTTQSSANNQPLVLPTDYARQGEASTAADKVVNKLGETQAMPDSTEPNLTNPLPDYFNPIKAWTVPVQSGSCPSGSFTWNNHTYNFDAMCTLFESNLTIIQGATTVFYSILALLIVLGA